MQTGNGVLYLPSVNHSKIIEIHNVDFSEAEDFARMFSLQAVSSSMRRIKPIMDGITKLKADEHTILSHQLFTQYIDKVDIGDVPCPVLHVSVLKELKDFVNVNLGNGIKCKRAIFVDNYESRIAIGTTLFGPERCYINYLDPSVEAKLNQIQTRIDNYSYQDTI